MGFSHVYDQQLYCEVAQCVYRHSALSKPAKATLLAMAAFTNPTNLQAFPSAGTIAEMTGYSRRAIQRAWRELEAHGLIKDQGQRVVQGSPSSKVFRLKRDRILIEGGHSVQRTSASNMDMDMDSVDTVSTEEPRTSVGKWLYPLCDRLAQLLANILIAEGLKDERYRHDATSELWVHYMRRFVDATIHGVRHRVGDVDSEMIASVYEKAVQLSPEHIDFRNASQVCPAPKLMLSKADLLVGQACRTVLPPPKEERPATPSMKELEEMRQSREESRAFSEKRLRERQRRYEARGPAITVASDPPAPRITVDLARERREDEEFEQEIGDLLGAI